MGLILLLISYTTAKILILFNLPFLPCNFFDTTGIINVQFCICKLLKLAILCLFLLTGYLQN